MKPVAFDYYRPDTIADAVSLLGEMREEAVVLAGGMTLGPMLNLRVVRPRAVVDITRIEALKGISGNERSVSIGAATVQRHAMTSDLVREKVPLLARGLPWVGHFQTRNRGTIGGSVAHADPSAEIPLCLVTAGGAVVLQSRKGERRVAAADFFEDALTTQRRSDELILRVEWPCVEAGAGHAFVEIAQRHGDFALVSVACEVRIGPDGALAGISLGVGGVESRPVKIDAGRFAGGPISEVRSALGEYAAESLNANEDHLANAEFRLALTRELVSRAVLAAAENARERMRALQ